MISSKIEKLIVKYITKSASVDDLDVLTEWAKKPENNRLFKDYIQSNHFYNFCLNDPDSDQIEKQLLDEIRKDKSIFYRLKYKSLLKYAAIFIGIIGVTYFFIDDVKTINKEQDKLTIIEEDITIELDNGNIKVIDVKEENEIFDKDGNIVAVQKGSTIDYKSASNIKSLVYNKISVPYGKTLQLRLSDGTEVHMNAGSSLKYPVKFITGKERLVYVKGEAYFNVTTDKKHPFIVNARDMNIRVTGTEFNVSSYEEDININTVLVEGVVELYNKNKEYNNSTAIKLNPGELGAWNKQTAEINVSPVDTSIHTSWKEGVLIFERMKFKNILMKLERCYNIKIINKNQDLNETVFTARFTNQTINHILKSFRENFTIDYKIENNQVIIN